MGRANWHGGWPSGLAGSGHAPACATGERLLGGDHPDTLSCRNNLASSYCAVGEPGRAIALFEQTLADC
ncbi:hypothetical protein Aph01nite_11480 [Acrocarpospora phusangensis]|uniref:Tetratricopeptide repeat protein n=1 Tax=Acrocarpospora phusangensis TaxID=1070424 RepID=A0A919Q6I7_9ACTN|nr:tetratricopeptide repeat protein [Acrocarpospora phusangensis]GIH22838.1 hypothetical protein Aph01nite_11480 [Acrocarpospora phusangensis]